MLAIAMLSSTAVFAGGGKDKNQPLPKHVIKDVRKQRIAAKQLFVL